MAGINQTVQAAQSGVMPQPQSDMDKWLQYKKETTPWSQQHPWQSSGLAGGLGMLGGSLAGMLGGGGMWGKPEKTNQVPLYSQGIMNLKEQMPQNIMQQLMGDQFDFGPIEQLTRQNFSSQTLPSLMGRFNMGNNRASSNQFGAMGNAGQGLDAQLAAMRQGYGQQRQSLLASLLPGLMSPSFENVHQDRQAGGLEQGISSIMGMLPYLLPLL
jgi:hypothetical protein